MLLIRRLIELLDLSLCSVPTTSVCYWRSRNLDIVLLSGYATIFVNVSNLSEHLQPLCCPSHPRFLNSRMHCKSLPPVSDVPLVRLITQISELRYFIALTYMLEILLWPRCLRGSPSNLAMFCDPSVMILAFILESIPWCYLVIGILFLGSWTRDSLHLLRVDSNC